MTGQGRDIAITGASGFVGGAVARRLLTSGHRIHCFGRRPAASVPDWMRPHYRTWDIGAGPLADAPRVDAVVHAAGAVDDWGTLPAYQRANVDGTRHVLESWPDARFVHVSSGSVYDPHASHELVRETDADPTDAAAFDRVRWLNAYGRTKHLAEHVVVTEAPDRSIILRPHAVYGPGDTTLLPRLLRRVRFGRLLMVGRPETRVSLTHIDNLVHAVDRAIDGDASGAFNVADPTALGLGELLLHALRATGRPERITWIPAGPAWAFAHVAEATHLYGRLPRPIVTRYQLSHVIRPFVYDLTRATRELGYSPPVDVPDSLTTIQAEPSRHPLR